MTGLFSRSLDTLIDNAGRDFVSNLLASYTCPQNQDIQEFINNKALDFSDRGIAKTHLAFLEDPDFRFAGVFTLSSKVISIAGRELSNTKRKKFERFGRLDEKTGLITIPIVLIAQFGKNFSNAINNDVVGSDLMDVACEKVRSIQREMGGKLVMVECQDISQLTEFYENNGFERIEPDASSVQSGLLQYVRFLG